MLATRGCHYIILLDIKLSGSKKISFTRFSSFVYEWVSIQAYTAHNNNIQCLGYRVKNIINTVPIRCNVYVTLKNSHEIHERLY